VRSFVFAAGLAGLAACVTLALTGANTVPPTNADDSSQAAGADDFKPGECAALTLTSTVTGTVGTAGNDLLIGSTGADTMLAQDGNDCVLGGGGVDVIDGGAGTDVCLGGPGLDSFLNCETQVQ
jgi:Ca2+-binding RTX toxin-like protein